jgi:AcrR family transcriptional regulator
MGKPSRGKAESQEAKAPKPGRRERHRAETRERIFRAALRLFAERGFPATTVEDITEAADVGKGTFFNYFPSKEHVLAAFSELQVGKIATAVADPRLTERPPREILRRMVNELAEEPGRSPALVRALLTAMLTSEEVRQLVLRNLRRAWEMLSALFVRAQKRGVIRRDIEPLQLARAMQQMFFGTLFLWALDPSEKLALRFERSFDLFWAGIGGKE